MFPETERSMSLRLRIVSGYFSLSERSHANLPISSESEMWKSISGHFGIVRLFFHCAIQRLLDAIADLCLSKARIAYLQDRDRIRAIASIILNYADA